MLVTVLKGVRIAYCCQVKKSETVYIINTTNSFVLYFSVLHLIHTARCPQKECNATSLKYYHRKYNHHTTTILRHFFRDQPGEQVP